MYLGFVQLRKTAVELAPQVASDCLGGAEFRFGNGWAVAWRNLQCVESPTELVLSDYAGDSTAEINGWVGPFAWLRIGRENGDLQVYRDHFGQRAVYYTMPTNGYLAFSDSLSALLALPGVTKQADILALSDYLSLGYIPAPETFYCGVFQLPAAHSLSVRGCGSIPCVARYWRPSFTPKQKISGRHALAEAWGMLGDITSDCLKAHSNAGLLLSGGVDSNVLLGLSRTAENPVVAAYTVGFGDVPAYDERGEAALGARAAEVRHVTADVSAEVCEHLGEYQKANGQPFADSSLIPTLAAMKLARDDGRDWVITGSGGDELFGGYRRYKAVRLSEALGRCLPPFGRRMVSHLLCGLCHRPTDIRAKGASLYRFASFIGGDFLSGYAQFQAVFSPELKHELSRDWRLREARDVTQDWQSKLEWRTAKSMTESMNELELSGYLVDDGCCKERLAAAIIGVQACAPMLNPKLAEFAVSLPEKLRVPLCGAPKPILRGIAKALFPKENVVGRVKRGFGFPVADWLRTHLRSQVLDLADSAHQWDAQGWFDHAALQTLVQRHLDGSVNAGAPLWALLCLKAFLE